MKLLLIIASLLCAQIALAQTASHIGFNGFEKSAQFNERIASFVLEPEVKVHINAPPEKEFRAGKHFVLVFYALPNGNTIAQTVGKKLKPSDDWHYDIQHIGAQTRFLRKHLTNQFIVVAYLEADSKSWPAWRKKHGDAKILDVVLHVRNIFTNKHEVVLNGHSGGGSFIFGYINAVEKISSDITRIAFLDSNYAYNGTNHFDKLTAWLKAPHKPHLCVLAYNDAVALLNGKTFVSAEGGTWGRSQAMLRDLKTTFDFTKKILDETLELQSALDGHVQFLLKENPERKIFHTVQVEKNGFIHSMVSGTKHEDKGYEYFGERAYSQWVQHE